MCARFPSPRHQVRESSDLAASQAVVLVGGCCTTRESVETRGGRVGEGERQMPCLGLLGCEEPLGRGGANSPREHLSPPRSNRGAQSHNNARLWERDKRVCVWCGQKGGPIVSCSQHAWSNRASLVSASSSCSSTPKKRHDKARREGGQRTRHSKPHFYGCSCSGRSRAERVLGAVRCPRDVEAGVWAWLGGGFLKPFFVGL